MKQAIYEELTIDFFIEFLKNKGFKIQGGTVHDFLKMCYYKYSEFTENFCIFLKYQEKRFLIGYKKTKPDLSPCEKIISLKNYN